MTPGEGTWSVQFINRDEQYARIRRWRDEAAATGLGGPYATALRAIFDGLSQRPVEFGDPLYRASAAGFVVYHRLQGLLQVWYAVPDAARVVWVQEVRPRDGLGFSQE